MSQHRVVFDKWMTALTSEYLASMTAWPRILLCCIFTLLLGLHACSDSAELDNILPVEWEPFDVVLRRSNLIVIATVAKIDTVERTPAGLAARYSDRVTVEIERQRIAVDVNAVIQGRFDVEQPLPFQWNRGILTVLTAADPAFQEYFGRGPKGPMEGFPLRIGDTHVFFLIDSGRSVEAAAALRHSWLPACGYDRAAAEDEFAGGLDVKRRVVQALLPRRGIAGATDPCIENTRELLELIGPYEFFRHVLSLRNATPVSESAWSTLDDVLPSYLKASASEERLERLLFRVTSEDGTHIDQVVEQSVYRHHANAACEYLASVSLTDYMPLREGACEVARKRLGCGPIAECEDDANGDRE